MNHYLLDIHSSYCEQVHNQSDCRFNACEENPSRFLFFAGDDFHLITYFDCLDGFDRYDFRKKLVEQIFIKSKTFERWEVNRGVSIEKDLKDFRYRNKSLGKYIHQTNFIYCNNAGREFAITTKVDYLDSICNMPELVEKYNEAYKFLEDNGLQYLKEPLFDLYSANAINHSYSPVECCKTIDHLVKSIHKLIK